eukprot:35166-Rhodomonas_salina.2
MTKSNTCNTKRSALHARTAAVAFDFAVADVCITSCAHTVCVASVRARTLSPSLASSTASSPATFLHTHPAPSTSAVQLIERTEVRRNQAVTVGEMT